jgi:hypothetical protein
MELARSALTMRPPRPGQNRPRFRPQMPHGRTMLRKPSVGLKIACLVLSASISLDIEL